MNSGWGGFLGRDSPMYGQARMGARLAILDRKRPLRAIRVGKLGAQLAPRLLIPYCYDPPEVFNYLLSGAGVSINVPD